MHTLLSTLNISFSDTGLVSALDDVVGGTVKALKDTGMFDNTIIIFTSDVSTCMWKLKLHKYILNKINVTQQRS